ncbi:MAG TPA: twin-arginine translocase subunit TatC [Anaerolineales bacterium]|nr:twin-arginine translocase subunit TatC [Anaerolineales bacterium]
MSAIDTESDVTKKRKRGWDSYLRAFGRAHRKASLQLETSMPLLQHLDELRRRLFKAFMALIATTAICFMFARQIIDYLAAPVGGPQKLVSIEITENIAIFMKVSLLGGFILGMPFIVYQILAFIMPGLKDSERRWVLILVPLATILFAGGAAFTWFVMLPSAIPFLTGFLGITTQVRPENYFDFITRLMFWIGICFELPLIIMFMAKLKFVTAKQLASGWRYAVVAIAVVAAAVTPTVDPVNMGLVMAPLMGLYVISILLAAIVGRG